MKRNKQTVRAARRKKSRTGKSRYAEKRESGKQMYGPGCCAHSLWEGPNAPYAVRRRWAEARAEIDEVVVEIEEAA